MNFGAVILAGGQSSRMGRDKAWLTCGGCSLLARQSELARELGAAEIFISGRPGVDYSSLHFPVLTDAPPHAGPLAGIAAALRAVRQPQLLVLAVDMPLLTVDFLRRLHARLRPGVGAIPRRGEVIEPLAAFYPQSAGAGLDHLAPAAGGRFTPGAKHFAQWCVQSGCAQWVPVPPADEQLFASWNAPADLPPPLRFSAAKPNS